MKLTERENLLLRRALDKATTPAEAETAAKAFVASLRSPGINVYHFVPPPGQRQPEPEPTATKPEPPQPQPSQAERAAETVRQYGPTKESNRALFQLFGFIVLLGWGGLGLAALFDSTTADHRETTAATPPYVGPSRLDNAMQALRDFKVGTP